MLYRNPKNTWTNMITPSIVQRTDTTQIVCSVSRLNKRKDYHVVFREFSHYLNKEESIGGFSLETVPYKPTENGVSFPLEKLDEIIDTLLQIKYDVEEIQSLC